MLEYMVWSPYLEPYFDFNCIKLLFYNATPWTRFKKKMARNNVTNITDKRNVNVDKKLDCQVKAFCIYNGRKHRRRIV